MAFASRVSPELAARLQPMIDSIAQQLGRERHVVQGAILQALEASEQRVTMTTVELALKDPKALVEQYLARKQAGLAEFDRNLEAMVKRLDRRHPEVTLAVLKASFPDLRDFRKLRMLAVLQRENGNTPLRLEPLPADVVLENCSETLRSRWVNGKLVLKSVEQVLFRNGRGYGPLPTETAFQSRELKGPDLV